MTENRVERPWKRWRVFLALGAVVILVPGLIVGAAYGVFYAQSKAELEAEIAKIRARGEPVWFSEISLGSPDALTAGDQLYKLMGELPRPPSAFDQLLGAKPPTPPGDYPEFRTTLAEHRELLASIVRAARHPAVRFRYDPNVKLPVMMLMLLPQVDKVVPVNNMLQADVLQSLGTGDEARAVEAIGEGLDLARVLRDEPLICRLAYCWEVKRMLDLLEMALRQVRLRPDDLRALDNRLARMEPEVRMASAIQSERAAILTTMNAIGSKEFRDILAAYAHLDDGDPTFRNPEWKSFWWSSGFYRPRLMHEQAFMLRVTSRVAAVIDQPGLSGKMACDRLEADLPSIANRSSRFAHMPVNCVLMPGSYGGVRVAALDCRQRLITARLALRVCRYRAEEGKWPESLEMVLDKELPSLKKGLFSDRPLVYDVEDDGFAIYDVDSDGQEPRGRFAVKGVKPE